MNERCHFFDICILKAAFSQVHERFAKDVNVEKILSSENLPELRCGAETSSIIVLECGKRSRKF